VLTALLLIGASPALVNAEAALEAFDARAALTHLASARGEGPHRHAAYVRLWELTAIAHAYLGDEAIALEAFDTVLALSAGHAVDYTLSPKVTFLFSRARAAAAERRPTTIDVSWPRGRLTGEPLPIAIEVVADPKRLITSANVRWKTATSIDSVDVHLGSGSATVVVPAQPTGLGPMSIQLAVSAFDARGNEVLVYSDERHPREIGLADDPPPQWYEQWWFWTIAAAVVAGGTGAGVYAATRGQPDEIDATVSFRR